MWRQTKVDKALRDRIQRTMFGALVRGSLPTFLILIVLGVITGWNAAGQGDWTFVIILVAMIVVIPALLWRTASRTAGQLPDGTWIAYAVTPDGTLHSSTVAGTTTVNPGFVAQLAATKEAWLIRLRSGQLLVAPRELLPDGDAALLVRHLPGRLISPPAAV